MTKKVKTSDSLESFFKQNCEFDMFVDTFDAICGTNFKRFKDWERVEVSPMLMYAYEDLQLVWRDVLKHLDNSSEPCTTIEITESKPDKSHPAYNLCNPDMIYKTKCTFKYKSNSFTVKHCKGMGWMISMKKGEEEEEESD